MPETPGERPLPHVAIVILNWNGLHDTLECLGSLARITYPHFSIFVVDNGSTDGSPGAIAAWKKEGRRVVLIRNARNAGFTGGCNIGLRRAMSNGADYVLLLNNDTVVTSAFLTRLVTVAERGATVGMVGPKVYRYGESRMIDSAGTRAIVWLGQPFLRGHGEVDHGQYDREEDVPYITGCALLIKREVIERVGWLDEDYVNYFEDFDWGRRAAKIGYRLVYAPHASIQHKGSRTSGFESPAYHYHMLRSRILFARKHVGRLPFLFAFLPYVVLYRYLWTVVRLIRHGRWDRVRALSRGFAEGFTTRLKRR